MADPQRANLSRNLVHLRLAPKRTAPASASPSRPSRPAPGGEGSAVPAIVLEVRVRLDCDRGLIEARRQSRQLASRCGFTHADRAIVTAIVSELGRNILLYATSGEIVMKVVAENSRTGILLTACDHGPGIPDLPRAMRDGYSTSGRPGMGLPGVKRLADEFTVDSGPHRGTTVVVRKWRS